MTRGDQRNPEPAERKPFGPLGWAVVAICFLALLLNFVAWSGGSFHEVRCLSVAIGLFTILLLLVHLRVKQQLEREIAERLHVELALRRFIQHAPVPVAMLDRQMNYVIHSRRWVQDFRLGEADLAGRNHYEVFPEIPERWKEVHQRCLAGAVEVCDEDAFARRDGTMEWLRWEVLPWHEADGRIGGLILFVEMITRRKQAEQALEGALRREEAMGRFRDRVVAVRSLEDVGRLRQRWIEAVSSLGIPVRSVSFEFPSPRPGQYRTGWLAEEHASLADHPLSAYPWVQQAWETGRPVVVTRAQMGDAGGLSPEVQAILEIPLPGIGSLGVSSTKADAFAPEAIQTLQAFAGLVAEGLQRTRDFLALQESADRLRLMVQQMPAVLWTTDTDLRFTSCQGAGLEGIHLLPDQVHGLTLFEFFRTSDPEFLPIAAHRAALRGESSTYESAWMGRTFQSHVEPLHDARGQILGAIAVSSDITDRKRAEEQIRREKEFSERLIQSSFDGIFAFDRQCRYTVWNAAMEQMTGFRKEEVLGRSALEVFPSLGETGEDTFFHEALAGMTVVARDRPYVSPASGRRGFYEGYFSPLLNNEDDVQGGIAIIRDITERKRAEESLRETNQTLRALIQASPLAIISIDRDLRVTKWNSAAERIFGWSEKEVLGGPNPIVPEDRQEEYRSLVQVVMNGEGFSGVQVRRRRRDGTPIDVNLFTAPLRDAGDRIHGAVAIFEDVTEQRRKEEERKESEERFRKIFEEGPLGMAIFGLDYSLLRVNATLCQMVGYEEEELTRLALGGITHPEDIGRDLADMKRLVSGQVSRYRAEKRFIRKNREVIWVTVTYSMIRGSGGGPLYCLGMVEDITEHKRAEQALRETNQTLQTLIRASPLAILATDLHGLVTMWNPAAEQIFGWTAEEALGRLPPNVPREKDEEVSSLRESALWGNTFAGVEVRRQRKDGTTIDVSLSLAPLRDAREEIVGIVNILADITERKRVERELRESEERYRRFFEEDLSGAFISTPDGQLLACNPAFARIFGFESCEEATRYNMASLYPDPQARQAALDLLLSEKKLELYEAELRRRDGKPVHVIENVVGTFNEKGDLVGMKGYLFDISMRKRLQEELRHAQKMEAVGRLAGGVAHDFNNVLTAILGYSELLLARLGELDPMRMDVEEIRKAGERAAALTRQLLVFSRRQMIQPKVLDLNAVVGGAEPMFRRLVGETIDLVVVPAQGLWPVKADAGQIEQVLMNLVVNARDAMPRGGRLTIETTNVELDEAYADRHVSVKPGPHVLLAVTDTGTGMDAETLSHIFEPFFTTKEQGTGLGLSTVYGIVKQSGGNIWVYSEPGRGTSFKIYMTRVQEKPEEARTDTSRSPSPQGRETILLVEDEEVVRTLTREILKRNGYTVLDARHGGEALLICERYKDRIHLLVTDVVMPQMTGRELAERLLTLHAEMKVLYVSGYPDVAVVRQGVLDPDMAFLQKPFTPAALARKVRSVLDGD